MDYLKKKEPKKISAGEVVSEEKSGTVDCIRKDLRRGKNRGGEEKCGGTILRDTPKG